MSCNTIRTVLCLIKGDDKIFYMALKDSQGLAIDLTGYEMLLDCKNDSFDRVAVMDDPTTGEFHFVFTNAETEYLVVGSVDGTVKQHHIADDTLESKHRVSLKVEGI